jgi:hypothetical protein
MMRDPSRIHIPGRLAPFAAGFRDWLVRHGYTPVSVWSQLHLMAQCGAVRPSGAAGSPPMATTSAESR